MLLACAPVARGQTLAAEAPAPASTDHPNGPSLAAIPLVTLSQTRDRPLFAPSRRPPPAALQAGTAAPQPSTREVAPPHLVLLGFVRSRERGPSAVVLDDVSRTSLSLRAGDSYAGWTVQTIGEDAVRLGNGADTVTLTFPAGPPSVAGGHAED